MSERDSWILRPYGGIRSTLVLYSGRHCLREAARCASRRHCTFLPHFPELGRVPGACCTCHTNSSIFKAFLACARVFCSHEEYALADFSGRWLPKASPSQYLLSVAVLDEFSHFVQVSSCFQEFVFVFPSVCGAFLKRFTHFLREGRYSVPEVVLGWHRLMNTGSPLAPER